MYCRACNTRIDGASGNCPHCGARLALQRANASSGSGDPFPLSPSTAHEPVDLELDDEVVEDAPAPARAKIVGRPGGRPRPAQQPPAARPDPEGPQSRGDQASGGFDPAVVRELVCDEPELIEPGLEVYEEGGRAIGGGFDTEVGSIDLLARGASGELVVVMVAEGEPGREFVANVLERVGWVRKHKSKSGEPVRAIVLAAGFGSDLGYAAAAVADTLTFKSWRVQILLEDVAV